MLREEVERYTKLTGEDGRHVTIARLGAYLDGYNKGLEVLDKIRTEIEHNKNMDYQRNRKTYDKCIEIIDKYKTESEE